MTAFSSRHIYGVLKVKFKFSIMRGSSFNSNYVAFTQSEKSGVRSVTVGASIRIAAQSDGDRRTTKKKKV